MTEQITDHTVIGLSNATLEALPDGVSTPSYDRSKLTPGIVHIGLGNFHRAHQAWYLHRLMQRGLAHNWAIIGAGAPLRCDNATAFAKTGLFDHSG